MRMSVAVTHSCNTNSALKFKGSLPCNIKGQSLFLLHPIVFSQTYFSISETALFSLKVPRFRTLVLLIRVVLRWRWVWSIGGMVKTAENWSSGRETLYSVGGRWMNGYGALVEWYWQGKIEVLGEKHYIAWVVGEWMGMEHWWNGTDRGKQK